MRSDLFYCIKRVLTDVILSCVCYVCVEEMIWTEEGRGKGKWKRLHNEELNDLYSSPNIVQLIKSRRMRWAGHVARMGEERVVIGSWWGNRREGDHWGDLV